MQLLPLFFFKYFKWLYMEGFKVTQNIIQRSRLYAITGMLHSSLNTLMLFFADLEREEKEEEEEEEEGGTNGGQ